MVAVTPTEPSPSRTSVQHRTIASLFWMLSGTGAASVLNLAVLATLARLLGPSEFGLIEAALVVVLFTDLFSHIGVGPAIVQRRDLTDPHIRSGFTFSLLFGSLSGVAVVVLAPWIALWFRQPALADALRVLALGFPLTGVAVVAEGLLQKHLRYKRLSAINVITFAVGYGGVAIAAAAAGFGAWSLVLGVLAQRVLRSSMILLASRHALGIRWDGRALRDLLGFGVGASMSDFLNFMALEGDRVIIGRFLGEAALGLYGRAYGLMAMSVKAFGGVLDKVMFSAMSLQQANPDKLKLGYTRGLSLVALTLLPTSLVSMVLAPEIVRVLLGRGWEGAVAPFQLLAVGMVFRVSYKVSTALAKATGRVYALPPRQAAYAALVVVGAYVGGTGWGVSGAAAGVTFALFVHSLVMAQLGVSILPGMTWRDTLSAHGPAVLLSLPTVAAAAAATWGLRGYGWSPVVVLAAGLLAGGLAAAAALHLAPRTMLGREGLWIADAMLAYAPRRVPLVPAYRARLRRRLALLDPDPVNPLDAG